MFPIVFLSGCYQKHQLLQRKSPPALHMYPLMASQTIVNPLISLQFTDLRTFHIHWNDIFNTGLRHSQSKDILSILRAPVLRLNCSTSLHCAAL